MSFLNDHATDKAFCPRLFTLLLQSEYGAVSEERYDPALVTEARLYPSTRSASPGHVEDSTARTRSSAALYVTPMPAPAAPTSQPHDGAATATETVTEHARFLLSAFLVCCFSTMNISVSAAGTTAACLPSAVGSIVCPVTWQRRPLPTGIGMRAVEEAQPETSRANVPVATATSPHVRQGRSFRGTVQILHG